MTTMIQHIIFDWDGTLAQTLHLWLAGYRTGLEAQQHTFPDSIIARDFFYEHDEGQKRCPDIDFDHLTTNARQYVHDHLSELDLYADAKNVLSQLSQKEITLSLVSSSPRTLLKAGMAIHYISDTFSSIIAGDDVLKRKPNPEAFLQTLSATETNPKETMIIGDAKSDVIAGKAAGIKTCLFTPVANELFYDFTELKVCGPDYQITSLKEILDIVSR